MRSGGGVGASTGPATSASAARGTQRTTPIPAVPATSTTAAAAAPQRRRGCAGSCSAAVSPRRTLISEESTGSPACTEREQVGQKFQAGRSACAPRGRSCGARAGGGASGACFTVPFYDDGRRPGVPGRERRNLSASRRRHGGSEGRGPEAEAEGGAEVARALGVRGHEGAGRRGARARGRRGVRRRRRA